MVSTTLAGCLFVSVVISVCFKGVVGEVCRSTMPEFQLSPKTFVAAQAASESLTLRAMSRRSKTPSIRWVSWCWSPSHHVTGFADACKPAHKAVRCPHTLRTAAVAGRCEGEAFLWREEHSIQVRTLAYSLQGIMPASRTQLEL
jgi:hypothetical protein